MRLRTDIKNWSDVIEVLLGCRDTNCPVDNCKKRSIAVPAKNLKSPDKMGFLIDAGFPLSLPMGAKYIYRDKREKCTIQVRYYQDGDASDINGGVHNQPVYHIQLDIHNPTQGLPEALGHLFKDLLGIEPPIDIN